MLLLLSYCPFFHDLSFSCKLWKLVKWFISAVGKVHTYNCLCHVWKTEKPIGEKKGIHNSAFKTKHTNAAGRSTFFWMAAGYQLPFFISFCGTLAEHQACLSSIGHTMASAPDWVLPAFEPSNSNQEIDKRLPLQHLTLFVWQLGNQSYGLHSSPCPLKHIF